MRRGLAVGLQKEKTQKLAVHAGGGRHNGGEKRNVLIVSVVLECVCVLITAVPITKLFAGGGRGEEMRTCATRDYEPRPV